MRGSAILGSIVTIFLAGRAAAAPEVMKIAVFDPQRVSEETEEGKKVQAALTALRDKKQAEIGAKEKELDGLQSQLAAQGLSLSGDRRSSLEKVIQKKALGSSRRVGETEMQLSRPHRQVQDSLGVVEQYGKEEGFT